VVYAAAGRAAGECLVCGEVDAAGVRPTTNDG
jgi:hypothetical protein